MSEPQPKTAFWNGREWNLECATCLHELGEVAEAIVEKIEAEAIAEQLDGVIATLSNSYAQARNPLTKQRLSGLIDKTIEIEREILKPRR